MILNWVGKPNYTSNAYGLVATLDVNDNFAINVEIGNLEGVNF